MRTNCIAAIALSLAVVAAGCHKRTRIATIPAVTVPPVEPRPVPSPRVTPLPIPADITPPNVAVVALEAANHAFAAARYDEAARLYQDYLRAQPSGGQRDQALFHLGLISALRPAPATDWQGAAAYFKQLFDEFPDTLLKAPANLLLSLHAQLDQATTDARLRDQRMRQLTTELDRYKKIDADRRKRP